VGAVLSRPPDRSLMRRGAELALLWWAILPLQGLAVLADIGAGSDSVGPLMTETLVGRVWLAEVLMVGLLVVLSWGSRTTGMAVAAFIAALIAVSLPALVGHGGLSGTHVAATVSLAGHLAAVATWVGGLAALTVVLVRQPSAMTLLPRFSAVALGCAIVAGETGLVNASLRLPTPSALLSTSYGSLVLAKAVLFAALVLLGWRQRRQALPAAEREAGPALVLRLAGVELLLMAAALGLSVILVRLGPAPPGAAGAAVAPVAAIALLAAPSLIVALRPPTGGVASWARQHPEIVAVIAVVALAEVAVLGLPQRLVGPELGALAAAAVLLACGWLLGPAMATRRIGVGLIVALGTGAAFLFGWTTGVPSGPALIAWFATIVVLTLWWRHARVVVRKSEPTSGQTMEVVSS
jgi:putative copper export protein